MSYDHDVISNHWQLDSLFNKLLKLIAVETSMILIIGP